MGAYLAQYAVFDVDALFLAAGLFHAQVRLFFICLIIGFILAPIWETRSSR